MLLTAGMIAMKWLWFGASLLAFLSVLLALNTIAVLSQRTADKRSDRDSEIAIMLCLYLVFYVLFAAALAENSIR